MKHVHEYTVGRRGSVETCRCGAFRFTEEYVAKCGGPIVEKRSEVEKTEAIDEHGLMLCVGCGRPIGAGEPSTTLEDEQYHDACAVREIERRQGRQ